MRVVISRATIAAAGLVAALSLIGCSALLAPSDRGESAGPEQAQPTQQTREAACEIVRSEWGFALDQWLGLELGNGRNDFAQEQIEHRAVIADLQDIADRIEDPELRSALDTTITVHQQYADEIWQGLMDIPPGYAAVMDDPTNKLVILGQKVADYKQAMADADLPRYDLCGAVQNGQTMSQACEIVDGAWTDGAMAFNGAAGSVSRGFIDEGTAEGATALGQLKAALVQVTVPDVLDELVVMHEAYQAYYDDQFVNATTADQMRGMSLDELDDLIAEMHTAFEEWDGVLKAGEEKLVASCDTAE